MSPDHEHYLFSNSASVPQRWREHLNCRHCKQQLVKYLGEALLTLAPSLLSDEQKLVISGCYEGGKAMGITPSGVHEFPQLMCNAVASFPGSPSFRAIIPRLTFDPPQRKAEGEPGRFCHMTRVMPRHRVYVSVFCVL